MFRKLTLFGVFLTLIMIVSGSWFRLSAADPALFNQNLVDILRSIPVYLTATAGLVVLLLGVFSWQQHHCRFAAVTSSLILLVLAGLSAALGFWAKAIVDMPVVIVTNVLLGMLTVWLLFWLYLRVNPLIAGQVNVKGQVRRGLVGFTRFAMVILVLEIILGAWVSANHAALACSGFPQCSGQWWPEADYFNALDLFNGLFTGYTGVISFDAQVAANWLHRVGALLCFLLLSLLMFSATLTNSLKQVRAAGLWLGALLFMQLGLAIIGLKLGMPVWAVLAHHAVGILLMLPLIAISFYSRYGWVETQIPVTKKTQRRQKFVKTDAVAVPVEVFEEAVYVEPAPESLYLRLTSQLKRTRSGLSGMLASLPIGQKEINDDLLEEIEAGLLMADVGFDATSDIIRHLTQSVERHQLQDGVALSAALKQELLGIIKPCSLPLQIPAQDTPFVILVVGVNGAGKTTTIGKLAKRLQAQGHSVMLAAGDTFRAAAVEQLQVWGERNNIQVVAQHTGADSASVIYDALQSAKAKGIDVLIADTAGRLHTKAHLMDELKKVKRIMSKLDQEAPHEVLLVLDAGTGQNALSQAKLFNETVALTGMVLTKLDGTAKGGVIFALAKHTGIPIRFIGIGEGIDDLQDFDAELFVDALFTKD
ncbi:signal recognition particle-docking protein FtsY [Methylobacter sp. S3L5C]|uniref:signal recognition particle-docking protein FtsY n=1 Tax=Methylobacter sp. S3L5C TaxID=2839024 RepID=UPI001FAC5B64|nr:signal recognition particle-docking protein FtsY [Methylobacter sp. S3L5C]UOA08515.1 signal recognition particle-docking protein FtsY [Methylobacter sp. S3L5C]